MFGGVFNDIHEDAGNWTKQRNEVKALLTPEEWDAAAASTINAHYTAAPIVQGIWKMAERLGFKAGRALETSAGIGNFIGLQPESQRGGTKWSAVELDKLSGAMLKLLYPDADVRVQGFQDFSAPDNFFDLAISNVPFSGTVRILSDPRYKKFNPPLHDYFFLKSVDKVRPGGLVVFITSTGTLDKGDTQIRAALAKQTDLVAAIRLPEDTFGKNAGTSVVTDLVILRKRAPSEESKGPAWTNLDAVPDPDGGADIPINEYFKNNPKQVLGNVDRKSRLYGKGHPHVSRTDDFEELWKAAIKRLPKDILAPTQAKQESFEPERMMVGTERPGQLTVKNGKLFKREGDALVEQPPPPKGVRTASNTRLQNEYKRQLSIVGALDGLRAAVSKVFETQLKGHDPAERDTARKELNRVYDDFVAKHGFINSKEVQQSLRDDPDYPVLAGMEVWDKKSQTATKGPFFERDTVRPFSRSEKPSSAAEAIAAVLNERGRLDEERMAEMLGQPGAEIVTELVSKKLAFEDPSNGLVTADEYLSGDVRQKLSDAEAAAQADPKYKPNIEALKAVIPADIPYDRISIRPGSAWMPAETLKEFVMKVLGADDGHLDIRHIEATGDWIVGFTKSGEKQFAYSPIVTQVWGTPDADFLEVLKSAMTGLPIKVTRTIKAGDRTETVVDKEATEAANNKVDQVRDEFADWVWADEARRGKLATLFNNKLNAVVRRKYDGSHLTFPGQLAPGNRLVHTGRIFNGLRPHQADAVWMTILRGTALYAHEVGTGKTMTMGTAAMELRRLGLANKPCILVPDQRVEDTFKEVQELYPGAKILAAASGMEASTRTATVAKIATGDWDIVILTHNNLTKIPVSLDVQKGYVDEQLAEIKELIRAEGFDPDDERGMKKAGFRNRVVKQLQASLLAAQERLKEITDQSGKDRGATFEQTGIDFLLVDEAHIFKSLKIHTRLGTIKGVPTGESNIATTLDMIAGYLQRRQNGRGLVLATGTPLTNSIAELYVMQRYVQRGELKRRGVLPFDSWASTFGITESKFEATHTGKYDTQTRFSKFTNLQSLQQMVQQVMHVVNVEDDPVLAAQIDRPKRIDSEEIVQSSPRQRAYLEDIGRRAENLRKVEKGGDNHLVIATDGTKAAMDMRLVQHGPEDPDTKAKRLVAKVFEIQRQHPGTTQMIFFEKGRSEDPRFDLGEDIIRKLVDGGILLRQIADFRGADRKKKAALIAKLKSGEVLVALGNTKTLGTGVNAQDKLKAIHHMEPSWTPEAMTQRNGRGWRQGNQNKEINIVTYLTAGSLDSWRWQTVARKARAFSEFMSGKTGDSFEEEDAEDPTTLGFERMQALSSGNPLLFERLNLKNDVGKLERSEVRYQRQRTRLREEIKNGENRAEFLADRLQRFESDRDHYETVRGEDFAFLDESGTKIEDREQAGKAVQRAFERVRQFTGEHRLGTYRAFTVKLRVGAPMWDGSEKTKQFYLEREAVHDFSPDALTTQKPEYVFASMDANLRNIAPYIEETIKKDIERNGRGLEQLRADVVRPWGDAEKLAKKRQRLQAVEQALQSGSAIDQAQRDADARPEADSLGSMGGSVLGGRQPLREEDVAGAIPSMPQEVARRMELANGVKAKPLTEKLAELGSELYRKSTRAQEFLPNTAKFASANEFFRLLKNVHEAARDRVARTVAAIVDPMGGGAQLKIFAWKGIIDNQLAGLERGEPLRFGFKSDDEVRAVKRDLDALVEQNPQIKQAVETRKKVVNEIVQELVDFDLLNAEHLANAETYFHQQVLTKMQVDRAAGGATPHVVQRGFQKERVTGVPALDERYDYNTSYLEAEHSWMLDAQVELEKAKLLRNHIERYDKLPAFKAEAKRRNFELLVGGPEAVKRIEKLRAAIKSDATDADDRKQFVQELAVLDPTQPYRQKIAWNIARIRALASNGRLPVGPYSELLDDDGEIDTDHPKWFAFLRYLTTAHRGEESAFAAEGIFKAINDREELIRNALKEKYSTWESLVRDDETHATWQPELGHVLYPAVTIPEKLVAAIQEKGVALVPGTDLRTVMALGPLKRQCVLPVEIAQQLSSMDKPKLAGPMESFVQDAMRGLKLWLLLRPSNYLQYYVRNLTGDVDPVLGAAPGVLSFTNAAIGDLSKYHRGNLALPDDLKKARDLAVIGSSMSAEEIPDIKTLPVFRRFYSSQGAAARLIDSLDQIKQFQVFRENVLRYAAFKHFRATLQQGTLKSYGGAKKEVVDALRREQGVDVAAAHLARGLLGDYGNLTVTGNWMRRYLIPFWSWQEINASRLPRMVINAAELGKREGGGSGGRGGGGSGAAGQGASEASSGGFGANAKAAAATTAYTTLRIAQIAALYALFQAWNRLMHPDEEDKLTDRDRSHPHIILGTNSDGTIKILRGVGATGEVAEWVGMNDLEALWPKYQAGQLTTADLLKEVAKAPVNKAVQGLNPVLKMPLEGFTGTSTFPDVFNPRSQARDEVIPNNLALRDEYRALKGVVTGDGTRARPQYWQRYLMGVVDPRQNALSEIHDLRTRYLASKGQERPGINVASPFKTLRDAAMADDFEAFQQARRAYMAGGKSYDNFKKSLPFLDPIGPRLKDVDEQKFEHEFLTPLQRERLGVAREYAHELQVKLFAWWKQATANETGASREHFERIFELDLRIKALQLSRPRPLKLDKLDDYEREINNARRWVEDHGVTRDDLSRVLRNRKTNLKSSIRNE